MSQVIITGDNCIKELNEVLIEIASKKFLLVCGNSYYHLENKSIIDNVSTPMVAFSNFKPNPSYEDVCSGVETFNFENCDAIVAIGGGSAIDVAKCIKLFCKLNEKKNYLEQEYFDTCVPLIAIPTTAGTGSESTRYAVVYYNGQKQSITHDSIIPNYAFLDHSALKTLPAYQKKCTMLDALCQAIESWWSVNSTDESKLFSKKAVRLICDNYESYIFDNSSTAAEQIMLASNYSGKAINITQTTAAHAMSYKLTSLYNLPHGHAVAACLPKVWMYMCNNTGNCIDSRGSKHLIKVFEDISKELSCKTVRGAITWFEDMLLDLSIDNPMTENETDFDLLASSVNLARLKNNPVKLEWQTLLNLYKDIVEVK